MLGKRGINLIAFGIVLLPFFIYLFLTTYVTEINNHVDFHLFYVLVSSVIAFFLGYAAYLEYRKNKVDKIYFIALGFIGVGVFYTFHALVTPNMTFLKLFEFPSIASNVSAFVMFGDLSRLWLALMIFIPDRLFDKNQNARKFFTGYALIGFAIVLTVLVYYGLLTPEIFPSFKNSDLSDTNLAILTKIMTLLLIGVNTLRYYYSYKAKSNITILSFVVGLVLIMETVIIFMISKPWSAEWWLAHNLFLASYLVIGFGVLYSLFSKEQYGFFDVYGQIEQYTSLLEEKNKELDAIANIDSMTGLSNRRHFLITAEDYIEVAKKENSTFALLFIDLDFFKEVNDMFGHKTGDELLKILSKKMSSLIKTSDVASRVGGDEFVLLLKNVDKSQVQNIATRIVKKLNEPVLVGNNRCQVGASIGISIYPQDGSTIDELFAKSDEAMYAVKQSGRNKYRIIS
ncbi:MAG: GGDEF domain-containing protein [Erysipelothrix sp.]|jgi:diguanylate cyclase (GGDEF)-like protein|nr:GGDEF domain-containing protein [Erysipelothrix sp.]